MVRCQFYTKIGACRHGDKCSKVHVKPVHSKTVLMPHLYVPKTMASDFPEFFLDVFRQLATYGEVKSVVVCENENSHLNGNVYVKYATIQQAEAAVTGLNQQWFDGRPVHCELSPVENFGEAVCRAHDTNSCNRGDKCNYMHVHTQNDPTLKRILPSHQKLLLQKQLQELQESSAAQKAQAPVPPSLTLNMLLKMFNHEAAA